MEQPTDQPLPPSQATPLRSFAYKAQSQAGEMLSGTIDAATFDHARARLDALGLRIIDIRADKRPPTARLGGQDLIAFNQQLAQLAAAGMPLEHGLRLIAQDMRRGRLAATVNAVAAEMETGADVSEAFSRHARRFPPLYARLVEAGVRTANLPGILTSIGRHLDLVYRLRATLWQAISYPLLVLVVVGMLMVLLGLWVAPQFRSIFDAFAMELPTVTKALLAISGALPVIGVTLVALLVLLPLAWMLARAAGWDRAITDALLLPLPLIGPVLKRNLIARWCDVMRLGVDAGLDLPAAIELAGDAVHSRPLLADGRKLADALRCGSLAPAPQMRLLPQTIPAAIAFSSQKDQLSQLLDTMSRMQQEQAELRMAALPALLTPLLLLVLALAIGFTITALFAPMISLIQSVSGA